MVWGRDRRIMVLFPKSTEPAPLPVQAEAAEPKLGAAPCS